MELKNVKVSGGHQLSPHSVDFILTGHHILFCAMEGLPQRGCFMDSSFSDYGHCHQVGIRSVHHIYSNNFLLLFRMFHDPQLPLRTVLDAVSSFVSIIHSSLHAGVIARRTVSLEFPKFVFDFLFKIKDLLSDKPGRLFERNDFPSLYFKDSDFISHNKFGGHFIVFPIYMYCHLKFTQQNYYSKGKTLPRCFTETLSLKQVKKRV